MNRFSHFYFQKPEGLKRANSRWFVPGLLIYPFAGIFHHFTFIFVFWYLEARFLAGINVASVLTYLLCTRLHRRGYLLLAWSIALIEVLIHSIIATTVFGFEAGFHLYILLPTFAIFLGPSSRLTVTVGGALLSLCCYIGLYHAMKVYPPTSGISTSGLDVLYTYNLVSLFVLMGASAVFVRISVDRADEEVEREFNRSEHLLLNILPGPIATRLKNGEKPIADRVEHASVLFCDIVGFTTISSQHPPLEIVRMLNRFFELADDLAAASGLEKIKTIGDAYMVASGIPIERDDHAPAIASFALALRDAAPQISDPSGAPLKVRIGIHSGPVVAGVMGSKKFSYDLWGDTVNLASRMESHGIPGQVQISGDTRALLGDAFEYEERGEIPVKGKGPVSTFLLVRRAS